MAESETFNIDVVAESDDADSGEATVEQTRRKSPRRMAYWTVHYQDLAGKWHQAKTENVSEGGLQITLEDSMVNGTKVFIKITLVYRNFKRKVQAIAESRYCYVTNVGFKTGFMFLRIQDSDREFFRRYAEKLI